MLLFPLSVPAVWLTEVFFFLSFSGLEVMCSVSEFLVAFSVVIP